MIFYLLYLEIDIMDVLLELKFSIYLFLSYFLWYIRKLYNYVFIIGYVYVFFIEILLKINLMN